MTLLKTFRKGGIHPPESKLTAHDPIITIPLPTEVTLCFAQHIGAMSSACVAKGDKVKRGDRVAAAVGPVSANLHTPISGTVVKIDKSKNAFGFVVDTVTIAASEEEHEADTHARETAAPLRTRAEALALESAAIASLVEQAGIVGLGGATFPTKVKLTPPPGMKADVVIVNAAECEPYLTCDHALMLAHPAEIIHGTQLLMRAAGVERAVIAMEANKRDAAEALRKHLAGAPGISVELLRVKYPQGGEKQLIDAVTGRQVASGQLPVSVGAIVQNVATVYAVYRAVIFGEPLTERIVTVTGPGVKQPGNFLAAIGTPIRTLVDRAGGVPADTGKMVLGGPMMGKAVVTIDAPTVKGISGVLLMPRDQSRRLPVQPCIRCGRCVEACPMGLQPLLISTYSRLGRMEDAEAHSIMDCIECGSCSFTCPASRPLLDYIRVGKGAVGAAIRARKAAAAAK